MGVVLVVVQYFQTQGLALGARCGQSGCSPRQPHVILAKSGGTVGDQQHRRRLTGFCADCWQHANLRHGEDEVLDMGFLLQARVFVKGQRIDPSARLKGKVTDKEFSSFVDSCLQITRP